MTKTPIGFVVIASFIVFSDVANAVANNNQRNVCNIEVPFDYLMMALQWPPGICYSNLKKKCVSHGNRFVIHGNWPTFSNGTWPEFCCFQRDFDRRKVSEVEDGLKEKWGTLFTENSDEGFWRHEWKKHGTCAAVSSKLKGQRNYFSESLALYDRANVQSWLEKAAIIPHSASSSKRYTLRELHQAIESHTRKKVRFECRRLPRRIASDPILSGMYLCYDPTTLEYVDCKQRDDADCGNGNVMYLLKR
ncbi:Ribonuclease 2 [Halotydeus destructor]|nr:Ribonuclease 2 [Halotydeus destructor]